MSLADIELFSGEHAIELERFAVVFRSPLDEGDGGRFSDKIEQIKEQFGAIDDQKILQFVIGPGPAPKEPVFKRLVEFGRDGREIWFGQFGENAVALTCKRYTNWQEIWPQAKSRLELLLSCVDPQKFVSSIEYSVTDTLREKLKKDRKDQQLLSRNIFKQDVWVPGVLLEYSDPRWDFQCGQFPRNNEQSEHLERVAAKSVLAGDSILVQIENTFSNKFNEHVRLKELLDNDELSAHTIKVFDQFHDDNKKTVKKILVESLTDRMGL